VGALEGGYLLEMRLLLARLLEQLPLETKSDNNRSKEQRHLRVREILRPRQLRLARLQPRHQRRRPRLQLAQLGLRGMSESGVGDDLLNVDDLRQARPLRPQPRSLAGHAAQTRPDPAGVADSARVWQGGTRGRERRKYEPYAFSSTSADTCFMWFCSARPSSAFALARCALRAASSSHCLGELYTRPHGGNAPADPTVPSTPGPRVPA
jgi:hypothetical protein